jgi:hypothetical protein
MPRAADPAAWCPAVLHGIDWRTDMRLRRTPEGRRFRLTNDRGTPEILDPPTRKVRALSGCEVDLAHLH